MSEDQLKALLAKLKEDAGLREKLQGAADIDTAVALAKGAGYGISKADWIKYQANQTQNLSDEELEGIAGGAAACGYGCGTGPTKPKAPNNTGGSGCNCYTGARMGCPV